MIEAALKSVAVYRLSNSRIELRRRCFRIARHEHSLYCEIRVNHKFSTISTDLSKECTIEDISDVR